MHYVALVQSDVCTVNTQLRIIPPESVIVVEQLADLVDQLSALFNGRQKAIDEACEQGYQDGIVRAQEQCEKKSIQKILALEENYRQHCETQKKQVVSLALAVVDKLIDTIGRQNVLIQAIEKAYKTLAPKQMATLVVHSSLVDSMTARLSQCPYRILVEGSDHYTLDSAMLKTDTIEIAVGLDSQLAIIEDYLCQQNLDTVG